MLNKVMLSGVWLVVACNSDPELVMIESGERVCIYAASSREAGPQSFVVGSPVYVRSSLESVCPRPSCSRERSATCSVSDNGMDHHLNSTFSWIDTLGTTTVCEDSCVLLEAMCETGPLNAGKHVFVFDSAHSLAIQVPSDLDEAPCLSLR